MTHRLVKRLHAFGGAAIIAGASMLTQAQVATSRGAADNLKPEDQARALVEIDRFGNRLGPDARDGAQAREFRIGYNIAGFARAGDALWEVRYIRADATVEMLRQTYWVNLATKQILLIAGPHEPPDLAPENDPRALARTWYEANVGTLDNHADITYAPTWLAYEMPGFSIPGQHIMEVRISTIEGTLGILWVNVPLRRVHPVAGIWSAQKSPATGTRPVSPAPPPPAAR